MTDTATNGKGSERRPTNERQVAANWDKINWKKDKDNACKKKKTK